MQVTWANHGCIYDGDSSTGSKSGSAPFFLHWPAPHRIINAVMPSKQSLVFGLLSSFQVALGTDTGQRILALNKGVRFLIKSLHVLRNHD